jgi:hypothetical protein
VSLSSASSQAVTVDYATADGTATSKGKDKDYQGAKGRLTFNPGQTSQTVTVLVNGDTAVEPDETFFVNLSNAKNATISKSQAVGTITNYDGLVALAEGYSESSVVSLDTAPAGADGGAVGTLVNDAVFGSPLPVPGPTNSVRVAALDNIFASDWLFPLAASQRRARWQPWDMIGG